VILDAVRQAGQWDNTLILFVGDHGFNLGEHFMWGKVMLFEESARVPLLVRVPGVTRGAQAHGLVEMVDFFPTLAELCAVPAPAHLQGRSLVPQLRDAAAPGKEWAYTVVRRGEALGRAIRFEGWRYTEWGGPGQIELYDLAGDPHEWTNLAKDPAHAGGRAPRRGPVAARANAGGRAKNGPVALSCARWSGPIRAWPASAEAGAAGACFTPRRYLMTAAVRRRLRMQCGRAARPLRPLAAAGYRRGAARRGSPSRRGR
jgi:arylsulfatase A-like enzyme